MLAAGDGDGIVKDEAQAVEYYEAAARDGHVDAMLTLAVRLCVSAASTARPVAIAHAQRQHYHLQGQVVEASLKRAKHYAIRALGLGHPVDEEKLSIIFSFQDRVGGGEEGQGGG